MQDLTLFIQHHWLLSSFCIILSLALLFLELFRLKRAAAQLSPLQATQLINHQNALVIDLRPTEPYAKGHIIDSLSLPLAEFKEKSKKLEKMKARPLILVCARGLDSPKIATPLQNQGFHVHTLKGGIEGWINADLPVVK